MMSKNLSLGFAPKILEESSIIEEYVGENVFLEEKEGNENYWLGKPDLAGGKAILSLDLQQYKNVTGFRIKNTKRGEKQNHATEGFTIFGEDQNLLSGQLEDTQDMNDEVPTMNFSLDSPKLIRFVKFQIDSFYGNGGGLQYLSVEGNTHCIFISF